MKIVATILFGISIGVCGCATIAEVDRSYETIGTDPHRDSVVAQEKTQKALKKIREAKWGEAEILLQEALVADVTHGPAHNNLGWVYYQQGKFYLAAWEFEYSIRLMPNAAAPHNNLGLVYEAVKRDVEALESYQIARGLEPENPEYLANYTRAKIRNGERNFDTAALLKEVIFMDQRPEWREWAEEQLSVSHSELVQAGYVCEEPAIENYPTDSPIDSDSIDSPAGKVELPVLDIQPPPFIEESE